MQNSLDFLTQSGRIPQFRTVNGGIRIFPCLVCHGITDSIVKADFIVGRRIKDKPAGFKGFHDELVEGYYAYMCEDRNTLFKMKELWTWWAVMFPGQEKTLKKIKKTTALQEYKQLVKMLGEV